MSVSPELRLRLLSAVMLAPAALLMVWLGGLVMLAGLLVVTGLLAREWVGLVATPGGFLFLTASGAAALVTAHFDVVNWAFAGLIVVGLGMAIFAGGTMSARILAAIGPIYIGGACLSFLFLRMIPDIGGLLIVWLLLVVWATDTGAYFAGRTIGGAKLAPAISPGKTWAGLFGGMVVAAVVGALIAWYTVILPWNIAASAAAGLAVVSQVGDLFESWLKRRASVKDSGDLIPGHGGLLDRIDGMMTAAPVMAAFWMVSG